MTQGPDERRQGGRTRKWKLGCAARLLLAAALSAMPVAGRAEEVPAPPPGASSRVDAIRLRGTLRVAVLDEYPWLRKNHGGSGRPFDGPAWRLAEEYARRLGVRLETVPVDFDAKVAILSADRVDITIAPLLVTPERGKTVDLVPYSMSAQCLFGLADNSRLARAHGIDDLNRPDVTVAYNVGTPQGEWVIQRLPRAKRLGIRGNLAHVPVDEITTRRADVTTIDKFFFAGLAKKVPGLASLPRGDACLASQELPIPIGLAVAKNQPAFLAWLRGVASEIKPQVDAEEKRVQGAGR